MNTRDELVRAVEDSQAGRMGIIPATHTPHRTSPDDAGVDEAPSG